MNRPYDELYNSSHASLDMEEPTLLDEIRPLLPFLLIPVGMFAFLIFLMILIPALGLSLPLLPVMAILYGLYFLLRKHKNKLLVWGLRITLLLTTAVYIMIPVSLHLFEQEKSMYPVKRFVYTHGVNSWETSHPLLPDRIPEDCWDYNIITQGQAPTQDYHPSLYLTYYTDMQTLREYEVKLDETSYVERFENIPPDPEELEGLDEETLWRMNCPQALPGHVYQKLKLTDNLDNAVIYVADEYYNKGCLLNYETGLVVFWL